MRRSSKTIHNEINIVMITDDNYVLPTVVAIKSLSVNQQSSSKYNIYILTINLLEKNVLILKQQETENININIINSHNIILPYLHLNKSRHVSHAAVLKFFISNILDYLDKVLYIDSDIIIQKDLSELFNIDITKYYAAVIKDTLGELNPGYISKLGIKNKYYFNSGVMLLNTKLLRKDNIKDKLIEFRLNKEQHFMDQDAFNGVIGHNVKYISYKYNFLNYYLSVMNKNQLSQLFDENLTIYKKDKELYKTCTIIHLGGKEKPWIYNLGYLSKLYKIYYKQTQYKHIKLKLINMCPWYKSFFSINNSNDRKYKVITILGIKIKIKRIKHA